MAKIEKVQKDKQRSTKHTYRTKDRVTRTPLKTGGELQLTSCVCRLTKKYLIGVTSGAGTAYPSGAPEFTPGF
jgi:UTP-glucose-1-phosphate uridylyltransferase